MTRNRKIGKAALEIAEKMDLLEDLKILREKVIQVNNQKQLNPKFKGKYGGILREMGQELDEREGI
ncbi:hypothetical protein BMS3Bbin16_01128 [archaeon BMS3Bbin16]|nr:hypothetical protein BMS3Bbin16_01128 [archaeon BMS3Bbin16]